MTKIDKKRAAYLLPAAAVILVTWLSLIPGDAIPSAGWWFRRIPHNDKIVHFCFYFAITASVRFACAVNGRRVRIGSLLLLCISYGIVIEVLQGAFFHRGCDALDALANSLGAMAAAAIPFRWYREAAVLYL